MTSSHPRPLRVLHIVDTLGVGGAETWLVELLRHWSKTKRIQADVLMTSGNVGELDQEAKSLGAKLFYCRYGRSHLLSFTRSFRDVLRKGNYDAIHDHQDYTSGWHCLLSSGVWPPVRVAHVHNPWMHYDANYATSTIRKLTTNIGRHLLNRMVTHVCGTSAEVLRRYGFEPGRNLRPAVTVAHCGFAIDRFNSPPDPDRASVREEFGWAEDSRIILFAGRLDRAMEYDNPQNHKNSWFALNVAKAAAESDKRVCLIMAGAGDEMREQLEDAVRTWGLSNRLRLVGVRHDVPRLMRASDVLLFPSHQEGLGMVAVEAQAAGLRVLASTAVPRECVVLPEMCEFLPLDRGLMEWSEAVLRTFEWSPVPMSQCREAASASAFSIENSSALLEKIYCGSTA